MRLVSIMVNTITFIQFEVFMSLKISTQKVDTWKKRIQKDGLAGSTYFCQQGNKVFVTASSDHQSICHAVLGDDNGIHAGLDSYLRWDDVKATKLVDLLFAIEKSK
ncbi:TPA: hypothetical protein ACPZMQ_004502 [Yersinia enterocolitica]